MPYKVRLCFVLGLSVLSILAELARPWPVKLVVDYVLGGRPLPPWLVTVTSQLPGAETPRGLSSGLWLPQSSPWSRARRSRWPS